MNTKGCVRWGLWLGLPALAIVCIVAASLVYFQARARAFNFRPLVLIHNPINREHIPMGERVLVNATARNKNGIKNIELWVDGKFYFAQQAPADERLSSLVLMAPWEPLGGGEHTLVVRAVSQDGVGGQASIRIWVETAQLAESVPPEGETEEIAFESSEDSGPRASNPPTGGSPPSSDAPPAPADSPPGGGLELPAPSEPLSEEPVGVKIEALALETGVAYEQLHCYVSMGNLEPQWYPDADHDQSTDESFALVGDTQWNVSEYLTGDQVPVIMWPGNETLPFEVTCVGITAGGTDSVSLGMVEILAEPETWDGATRRAESLGDEGSFALDYRIGVPSPGMGFPAILVPSITPPTNLRTSGFYQLQWDWEPSTDPPEEPIDGFYIYVNNTLQFTVSDSAARSITLPPEWFNPPCGLDYNITMSAWRWNPDDHTDNFESFPSEPLTFTRDTLAECDIAAYVTFDALTFSGGFDDEGRSDSLGPLMLMMGVTSEGYSRSLTLDGFCRGGSPGDCVGVRLAPDVSHSIGTLMLMSDDPNNVRVPLTAEGLDINYILFDQDGDDTEMWCEGVVHVPREELFNTEGAVDYTNTLISRIPDGRCQVGYSIRSELIPSYGEDVSYPPLPQLGVEDIIIEDSRYWINVRNYSSATWAYDLKILMTRNSGEEINYFTLPDFVLSPGHDADIFDADMPTLTRPQDLCVTLDPENVVLESVERDNPGWTAGPFCLDAPDLRIETAGFNSEADPKLVITVLNYGSAPLETNEIRIKIINSIGLERTFLSTTGSSGLGPWESTPVEIAMSGLAGLVSSPDGRVGLTLIVDPNDDVIESDETNNTFSFGDGARRAQLLWNGFDFSSIEEHLGGYTYSGLSVTYYPYEDEHNYDYFHVRVYIDNGVEERLAAQFDMGCTVARGVGYGNYTHNCLGPSGVEHPSATLDLVRGESINLSVSGDVYADEAELSGSTRGHHELGEMWLTFSADDIEHLHACGERLPMGITRWGYVYPSGFSLPWYAGLTLCAQ
jgi:hypothetical protein